MTDAAKEPDDAGADPMPEQAPERPTMAPFLGALAIIVLVVIGIVLFNVFGTQQTTSGDQVARAAVGQNDALQRQDYGAFQEFTCRGDHDTEGGVLARQRDVVAKKGERTLDDVTQIQIDGDRASATVTYHFANTPDDKSDVPVRFVQEDGAWRVCSK